MVSNPDSVPSEPPDQAVESAILSLSYRDRITGQQRTIRGNADKLVIKKRRKQAEQGRKVLE